MRPAIFMALAALLASPVHALECWPTVASVCDGSGCGQAQNTIKISIDQRTNVISRCDKNGCDKFPVTATRTGAMQKYGSVERGYLLVIQSLTNEFSEVATQVTAVAVKTGLCTTE